MVYRENKVKIRVALWLLLRREKVWNANLLLKGKLFKIWFMATKSVLVYSMLYQDLPAFNKTAFNHLYSSKYWNIWQATGQQNLKWPCRLACDVMATSDDVIMKHSKQGAVSISEQLSCVLWQVYFMVKTGIQDYSILTIYLYQIIFSVYWFLGPIVTSIKFFIWIVNQWWVPSKTFEAMHPGISTWPLQEKSLLNVFISFSSVKWIILHALAYKLVVMKAKCYRIGLRRENGNSWHLFSQIWHWSKTSGRGCTHSCVKPSQRQPDWDRYSV